MLAQLLELLVIVNKKSLQEKGRVYPRSIQVRDEHPGSQVLGRNFLMHVLFNLARIKRAKEVALIGQKSGGLATAI